MSLLLGAHRATTGGRHHAFASGEAIGCGAIQIFTSSPRQWKPSKLSDEDLAAWGAAREGCQVEQVVAHDSYLINLAAANEAIREKSSRAFGEELERCRRLEIPYLVTHPGAHVGLGDEVGLTRFAESLRAIYEAHPEFETATLLETTAGQGTSLGHRFEQLAWLLDAIALPERIAVCVDTCHIHAAGYPLTDEEGYQRTMADLERTVGSERVKVLHLNDSKNPLGSRVDRHEQVGEGMIGEAGFRCLVNDPRWAGTPMIVETPELDRHGENLNRLRRLSGLEPFGID